MKTERSIRNDILGALVMAIPIAVLIVGGLFACGITDDLVFTRADWADAEKRVTTLDRHYREAIDDLADQYADAQAKAAAGEEVPDLDLDVADATAGEGRAVLAYFKTLREAGEGNFPGTIDDNEPAE